MLMPRAWSWRLLVLGGLLVAGVIVFYLAQPDAPARMAQFVEYPMAERLDTPTAVAVAPDGTVWFTLDLAAAVGRIHDGRLERLPIEKQNVDPLGIGVTADGTAWFTDNGARGISRVTAAGETATFALETPIVRLGRLAVGGDGAVWFAEGSGYSISEIRDGRLTRHVYDSPRGGPYGVAVAADGTAWATLKSGDQLLKIARDGGMTAYEVPGPGAVPSDVAVAKDGTVWFIDEREGRIGKFRDGVFQDFTALAGKPVLSGLAVGEDGAVWFGLLRDGGLGRLRGKRVDIFKLPRERARPVSLAIDRQGNVWYADISGYVGMLPARYARE